MQIKLIADGSTKLQRMIKRWGIAFLIGDDVLFDTFGDENVFMSNVKKFRVDLSKLRHIVISHDDWDHVAGLWPVLKEYKGLKVYVGPHFKAEFKERICALGGLLVETPEPVMVREHVYTTGELNGKTDRGLLYEQAVVILEAKRVAVVTGCAHPKLQDILSAAKVVSQCQDVDLLMGGFHLKDMGLEEIRGIVEGLPRLGVMKVVPLHCTGPLGVAEFKRFYLNSCCQLREGGVIDV